MRCPADCADRLALGSLGGWLAEQRTWRYAFSLMGIVGVSYCTVLIVLLRDVAPGAMIGYNARWTAARPSRIAVISAGYADGLMRALTNRGRALVRGKFVPLVGTISMDVATVDVTGIEGVKSGDVVTLYGKDGEATQWVSDVAALLGTVSSDLLCSIGKRVPRYYVD